MVLNVRSKAWVARLQTLFVLVGLVALFGIASPHFLGTDNLLNIMQQSAINAILGIGLDLRDHLGGHRPVGGLHPGVVRIWWWPISWSAGHSNRSSPSAPDCSWVSVAVFFNGLVTTLGRIPPFITTLGMMLIARSAAKIYSGSKPISGLPESFRTLIRQCGRGALCWYWSWPSLYVLAHLVLTRTKLGRYSYAIGGNEQAAWLSGVPVGRYKVAIYGLSGLMAGVAAVLMTSRLNAASPLSGEMYELYAIGCGGHRRRKPDGRRGSCSGNPDRGADHGHAAQRSQRAQRTVRTRGHGGGRSAGDRSGGARSCPPPCRGSDRKASLRGGDAIGSSFSQESSRRSHSGGWLPSDCGASSNAAEQGELNELAVAFVPKALNSPFWADMQQAAEARGRRPGGPSHLAGRRPRDGCGTPVPDHREPDPAEGGRHPAVAGRAPRSSYRRSARPTSRAYRCCCSTPGSTRRLPSRWAPTRSHLYRLGQLRRRRWLPGRYHGGKDSAAQSNVAIIEGISGHETADQRRLGFLSRASPAHPGIRVVASQTANWERALAYTVAENLCRRTLDLDAIFAANDEMALGARGSGRRCAAPLETGSR